MTTTQHNLSEVIGALAEDGAVASIHAWEKDPECTELQSAANGEMWSLIDAWARQNSDTDPEAEVDDIGRWAIDSNRQLAFFQVGLVSERLMRGGDIATALALVTSEFQADEPGMDIRLYTFLSELRRRYRAALGVDEFLAGRGASDEIEKVLDEIRDRVEVQKQAILDHLRAGEHGEAACELQEKLFRLMPAVALVSAIGGGATDRRTQMKVLESSRRLMNAIEEQVSTFERRKKYESLQNALKQSLIELRQAERSLQEARDGAKKFVVEPKQYGIAAKRAVAELQQMSRIVSRVGSQGVPPFVLEHLPRMSPNFVYTIWDRITETCPALEAMGFVPSVVLLPGVGNATYSAQRQLVIATVFPIEVKLQALTGAIGEAFIDTQKDLWESYRALKKLGFSEVGPLRDAFNTDFTNWVDAGCVSGGTQVNEWFREHLGGK